MKRSFHILFTLTAVLAFTAATLTAPPAPAKSWQDVDIQASLAGDSVIFQTGTSRDLLSLNVRVVGPGRYLFEGRVELAGALEWVPDFELADGNYSWEAWVVTANPGAAMRDLPADTPADIAIEHFYAFGDTQTHIASGEFRMHGGRLEAPAEQRADEEVSSVRRVASAIFDFVFPSAHAVTFDDSVQINRDSFGPTLNLFDPAGDSPWPLWRIRMLDPGNDFQLDYCDFALLGCTSEFVAMRVNRNTGHVGIGTAAPQSRLHVENSSGFQISLTTEAGGTRHRLDSFDGHLAIGRFGAQNQFVIRNGAPVNSLRIHDDGNIGVGTTTPAAPVHVQRADNSAEVRVTETGAGNSVLFRLVNNGAPKFRFENTSVADQRWEFGLAGTGGNERFVAFKVGSPDTQMQIFHNGNMVISGQYFPSSSRAVKERIEELNTETVLARLEALPVHEWSYQRSPKNRHIGPMAEEFYTAFGLGMDDKHISPNDLAGVALAAAKALQKENAELRERLERLEAILASAN